MTVGRGPRRRTPRLAVRALAWLAVSLIVVACGDEGPVSGPGTLTATLVGPNGPEGAALITLLGDDIGAVSAAGPTEVHVGDASASTIRVLLIDQAGGDLSFRVEVADTTQPPTAVVEQVAGPDDALRTSLQGYSVEFRR